MKRRMTTYTFFPATKQIAFTGPVDLSLSGLLLITNVTSNVIIYNFADSTVGGTLTDNMLTLTYDTTLMGVTDLLQVWYDDLAINPFSPPAHEAQMHEMMEDLLRVARQQRFLLRMIANATGSDDGSLNDEDIINAGQLIL